MHVANKVMKGTHDVFQTDTDDEEDSISLKKLKKQEAQWNSEKEVLGFHFDGIKKTICLSAKNVTLYCSRYPSVFKAQTRDINRMALAP